MIRIEYSNDFAIENPFTGNYEKIINDESDEIYGEVEINPSSAYEGKIHVMYLIHGQDGLRTYNYADGIDFVAITPEQLDVTIVDPPGETSTSKLLFSWNTEQNITEYDKPYNYLPTSLEFVWTLCHAIEEFYDGRTR